MATYDADRAERVLRQLTQASTDPVLTNQEIEDLLWRARVTDASGLGIDAILWTPTYGEAGIDAAASRGWRLKAAKIKDKIKVGLGTGLTFDDEAEYTHCLQMADYYEAKGGGIGAPASGGLFSVPIVTGWTTDV